MVEVSSKIHVSLVAPGDTVYHKGKMMTVCSGDIKRGFMGTTLFGDSYKLGTVPVQKVTFTTKKAS